MIAVGNVGKHLAPYQECDTFLTRDGGFTWEEVRKDAHLYEFGDSGSVLILANDERETDHIQYSLDEGLHWKEYKFGAKMRVYSIVTVPSDTSRKFILLGYQGRSTKGIAVHIDFSAVTRRQCKFLLFILDKVCCGTLIRPNLGVLRSNDPANDDFELWSPSEEREERCLFGRQVLYHRRRRGSNCVVGDQVKDPVQVVKNCECIASDFEWYDLLPGLEVTRQVNH